MCHSARLAQRNLPAGQKKTTKGLSNKKVLRRRVEIFRKFKFLKFRLTGKYFSEIQKDGHFDEKERKNRTTTNIVRNSRTRNVTFDQNGQNAIYADFEFLAVGLPD